MNSGSMKDECGRLSPRPKAGKDSLKLMDENIARTDRDPLDVIRWKERELQDEIQTKILLRREK